MKILLIVLACIPFALTECPDKGISKKWSEEYTSDVTTIDITEPILLDTTPPDLHHITIQPGGKLVWSPEGDHNLRAQYILIKPGGEMHIGGEDCQFQRKARITLYDGEEKNDVPNFGDKFIGVESGGVLELHGKDKLSWTKLTSTAHKFVPDIYNHMDHEPSTATGIYIYHFETEPTVRVKSKIFGQLGFKRQSKNDKSFRDLQNFCDNDITDNGLFAIATQGNLVRTDMTKLYDMFDGLDSANVFRSFENGDAYVAIGRKGNTFEDKLVKASEGAEAKLSRTFSEYDREVRVISYGSTNPAQFGISSYDVIRPIINVVDDVSSWKAGDKIFITSTDYDWNQVEEFTIIDCKSMCSSKQIRLDRELKYTHYGKIRHRVDMRAEVGMMTRYIHIEGDVSPGKINGGHVKFLHGFKSVRIEGVELTNMGNPEIIGRYPLHYHMCEDLKDRNIYATPSYIRSNSIHHCKFRCVTIHGTHHAHLTRNVCYNTVGHGFFLEDGGEKYTHLEGNLGLGNRRYTGLVEVPITGAIPTDVSDRGPVTYWITNPLTTLKNNVAAGGDGTGIWYVYPDEPTGPSRDKNFMERFEARRTKILLHENNVVHSYEKSGLFVDNIERDSLHVNGYNRYTPREIPTDPNSDYVAAVFERLTAYKNRQQNLWIRGSPVIVKKSSFSDSRIGAVLLREGPIWEQFVDNVVLGYSDNLGEPHGNHPRSFPGMPNGIVKGYMFHKGPIHVKNTWFGDFNSTDVYRTTAISQRKCENGMNPRDSVEEVTFGFTDGPGNRYFNCKVKEEKVKGPVILRDMGNSLTGLSGPNISLVRDRPFDVTGYCHIRAEWGVALCPHVYGKVFVRYDTENNMRCNVHRTDAPFPNLELRPNSGFLAILDGHHSYLVYINEALESKTITFEGSAISHTENVVVALCVPTDASFTFKFCMGKDCTFDVEQVNSIHDVIKDSEGGKHFFDTDVGVIFFKLINRFDFDDPLLECPKSSCVKVLITLENGGYNENNCVEDFLDTLGYIQPSSGNPKADTRTLPISRAEPEPSQGAGSTYPF